MLMVDLIEKKRNGLALTKSEIDWLIQKYSVGDIPDYQMAAFLMAVYFKGMTATETADLTMAMVESGDKVDFTDIPGIKVDKHSTGGVADTTTLIVLPLVAAMGVKVAKMSGRGLGFTGGTIDKLESIPGFVAELSDAEFKKQLKLYGMAITGQSPTLAPADGKLYALRDVTGTTASIPLIASSIMSKKIAAGADKILLDVKVGSGAFMDKLSDAIKLAETMVSIGDLVGRETRAVLTSMAEPLGEYIGNSLEVREAIEILSGKGQGPLRQVALMLGANLLQMAEVTNDTKEGYDKLEQVLLSGRGLEKFQELITIQHGNPAVVVQLGLLPQARYKVVVASTRKGYVQHINTAAIGKVAAMLGAGRMKKDQKIDLAAGIKMKCRIGDFLNEGDPLAVLESNILEMLEAEKLLRSSICIADEKPVKPIVIIGVVDNKGFTAM